MASGNLTVTVKATEIPAVAEVVTAARAVVDAWVDDESGMETFDPSLIDALAEALTALSRVAASEEPR